MAAILSARSNLLASRPCKARAVARTATVKVSAFKVDLHMQSGKIKTIEVAPDQAIFDAIEANNIDLPYLCRSGTCGTCAGRLQSGQVDHIGQHILSEDQVKAGFVLLCSTYPRSDCAILTHQEERLHTTAYGCH